MLFYKPITLFPSVLLCVIINLFFVNSTSIHIRVKFDICDRENFNISTKICPMCECGLANGPPKAISDSEVDEKVLAAYGVILGDDVEIVNQYPWMASIRLNGNHICGGSLINSRYLITSAFCVARSDHNNTKVYLSTHYYEMASNLNPIIRQANKVIIHENFNKSTFENNIAIIQLDKDVDILPSPSSPRPVCLSAEDEDLTGKIGLVTGWGRTSSANTHASVLQQLLMPIMSNDDCKKTAWGKLANVQITDSMVCAAYSDGEKGICKGDGGGPLTVVNNENKHLLVGISSFMGHDCDAKDHPAVFTRVNKYVNWINENTLDACKCL